MRIPGEKFVVMVYSVGAGAVSGCGVEASILKEDLVKQKSTVSWHHGVEIAGTNEMGQPAIYNNLYFVANITVSEASLIPSFIHSFIHNYVYSRV